MTTNNLDLSNQSSANQEQNLIKEGNEIHNKE